MAHAAQALTSSILVKSCHDRLATSHTRSARNSAPRRNVLCMAEYGPSPNGPSPNGNGEERDYTKDRTPNQNKIAEIDGAVRRAQKDLGKAIQTSFEKPLKFFGIGKVEKRLTMWEMQRAYLVNHTGSVTAAEVNAYLVRNGSLHPRGSFGVSSAASLCDSTGCEHSSDVHTYTKRIACMAYDNSASTAFTTTASLLVLSSACSFCAPLQHLRNFRGSVCSGEEHDEEGVRLTRCAAE
eukprot:9294781-Pyramimonas_sp.AAC.1